MLWDLHSRSEAPMNLGEIDCFSQVCSKMRSWSASYRNYLKCCLWCRFSGRFLMGIKIEISYAPRLHHETLAWCIRQEHPTKRTRFHVRVRIPSWGIHKLIVKSWKYNKTIEKIKISFCLQLHQNCRQIMQCRQIIIHQRLCAMPCKWLRLAQLVWGALK